MLVINYKNQHFKETDLFRSPTFTEPCNIETGKKLAGIELKKSRNSS